MASINEEWEYVQAQIAEEFEYIQAEIAKEMEYVVEEVGKTWEEVEQEIREEIDYSVEQTRDAVAEAVHEIKTWIQNPINQKEGKEFLDARKQALEDFVADEVFKSAPAEKKEEQLRDKIREQWRAEENTFGGRNDSLDIRDLVKQGLVEAREEARQATEARLEKNGYAPEVLEQELKQLDDAVKKQEQGREKAEVNRLELWEKAEAELRAIAAEAREQAERQDAEKRKQAEREMIDAFRSL